MSKLNHYRPVLQLLDNYRREIKIQAAIAKNSFPKATQNSGKNPMPPVSDVAHELILSIFEAATSYFNHLSAWLGTIPPDSNKALRRGRPALKAQLDQANDQLVDACTALVLEAMKEASRKENSVANWLDWLQKEAQRTKSSGLCEILDIGVKPALEKVDETGLLPAQWSII